MREKEMKGSRRKGRREEKTKSEKTSKYAEKTWQASLLVTATKMQLKESEACSS